MLQFVDQLVVERTGKHLDDLQRAVVEGTWQKQTYDDIAQKYHVTKNHVGDVAYQLWQLLSKELGEDVKKYNFRSVLERVHSKSSQNICIGTNHNFYLGSQILNQPNQKKEEINTNNQSKLLDYDLTLAPQIINFYNRETELDKLSDWIFNKNIRLISVLGLSGTGKTALVKRFVDLNLQEFEVIIWKSLKFPKSLDLMVYELLKISEPKLPESIEDKFKQLLTLLTNKKCLIIFDDLQNIFVSGQFAGQYQTDYLAYQKFFKIITEVEHQSSFILISQEQYSEMQCLDEDFYSMRSLELDGLYNIEIFQNLGLTQDEKWLQLIDLYEGNLFYLKDVIQLIKNVFGGKVDEFLAENSLVITQVINFYLTGLFNRLSPIEQKIVLHISKSEQFLSREDLRQSLSLSSMDLINGLQSLVQRYLIKRIEGDKVLFKLSPVFKEYVNYHILNTPDSF
ncbi:ATP-binding protein [Planktothrix tepida]|uniref:ATP-binding protein n=1 Tax=Planktothrix tepida TaxID=1678309 RepID=UPI001FE4FB07|nr:ATP-binding protein [Planktothrix tepida]